MHCTIFHPQSISWGKGNSSFYNLSTVIPHNRPAHTNVIMLYCKVPCHLSLFPTWNVCLSEVKSLMFLALLRRHRIDQQTKNNVAVCRITTTRHCMSSFRRQISFGFCLAEFLRVHSIVSHVLPNYVAISYVVEDLDFLAEQHQSQILTHSSCYNTHNKIMQLSVSHYCNSLPKSGWGREISQVSACLCVYTKLLLNWMTFDLHFVWQASSRSSSRGWGHKSKVKVTGRKFPFQQMMYIMMWQIYSESPQGNKWAHTLSQFTAFESFVLKWSSTKSFPMSLRKSSRIKVTWHLTPKQVMMFHAVRRIRPWWSQKPAPLPAAFWADPFLERLWDPPFIVHNSVLISANERIAGEIAGAWTFV